jgi:hypothetical protein
VAIGSSALENAVNAQGNVVIGAGAASQLFSTLVQNNVVIGLDALKLPGSANANVAIGYRALRSSTTEANLIGNTAIGYAAGIDVRGDFNTLIGNVAGGNVTTGGRNIAIGYGAGSTDAGLPGLINLTTQSDRIVLGDTRTTNAYVNVPWTVVSDARDKTDFAPVPHGLEFVTQLQPTAFRRKVSRDGAEAHGDVHYGLLAQDVLALEGSNPVIIDTEDPERLKLKDHSLIAVLINAIKELAARVEELEKK